MSVSTTERMPRTLFEFPLNERFRTYLRLEALYARWLYLLEQDSEHAHHSAVTTLLDMHQFAFRYDLKGDLLAEISRYKQTLSRLRHLPDLSEEKLTQVLLCLADAQKQIEMSPKFGSTLSDNDWLMGVKARLVAMSGVCSFDAAFYHQWLKQPASVRRVDLASWLMPMMPLFDTLKLVLLIARDTRKHKTCMTVDKVYQQPLHGTRFDLIQVDVSANTPYVPDVSANKHVIWLRFGVHSFHSQTQNLYVDSGQLEIAFELNLCGI